MQKWEYAESKFLQGLYEPVLDWQAVAKLGREGWEMVQIIPPKSAVFKRPVSE